MKRMLSAFLTLVMVIGILTSVPVSVSAASVSDLTFEKYHEEDSYCVADCSETASGKLVIPATYNGLPVEYIGDSAFSGCTSLTSITIPDSVTSIGDYAFSGCTSLTSITIPDSVTSIGSFAFRDCTSLTSITIPDSVTSISSYAFYNCTSLTSITIPDSVTSIGSDAFESCKSLTSITIPDRVTSIGGYAFSYCTSLKSITIPDSVTSIGDCAFSSCTSLTSITIPGSVTSIGEYAFRDCTSLKTIKLSQGVKSIGDFAFSKCHIAKITIPKSVTSISEKAFLEYDYNNGIYCGKLPVYCYKDSFTHSYLTEKGYKFALIDGTDEENTVSGKIGTISWSLNKLTGVLQLTGKGKIVDFSTADAPWYEWSAFVTSLQLPTGLTSIGEKAFKDMRRLTKAVIPAGVTNIGIYAFSECTCLKSVSIPEGVQSISNYAFYNCTSLASVAIPEGVTKIGAYAFSYCTSLASVTIPSSVTRIGSEAFSYCTSLTSVVIPEGVAGIERAFCYCKGLKSITLPSTLKYVWYDFSGCTSLEKLEFALNEKNSSKLTSMPDISDSLVKELFLPLSIKETDSGTFPATVEKITICNPEFEFASDCGLNYNTQIIGYAGSTAEAFAEQVGAEFVDFETVHTHNYKAFTEKGYCSFERCVCGKENSVAHTDADRNARCDDCDKFLNDLKLTKTTTIVQKYGEGEYLEFTATKSGNYTLTVSKVCYSIGLYDENKKLIKSKPDADTITYHLNAGDKGYCYVRYSYDSYAPATELELTLSLVEDHEHSYTSAVTKKPTCTREGVRTYTCACGDSYTKTIEANGHNYGAWYVAVAGSCSEGTVIQRDCADCDYSDTISTPASGEHTIVETLVRATDTHGGRIIKSCSVCGQKISEKKIAKIDSVELSSTKYTYNGKVKTPSVTVKDSKGNQLVKDQDYTVTYSSGRKSAGIYTVTVKFTGNYSGTEKLSFTILPKAPTSFDYTASSKTSVKLSWDASTGATGYIVYQYNKNAEKYEKIAIVDGEKTYTVSSLKAGSSYEFKIRAYKELKDDTVIYSSLTSAITAYTKTAAPTLKVSSASAGVASLSWSNVSGETGYQVYYSTKADSGFTKLGSYKTDVVNAEKKLTSGKTYYFKVRAYKKTSDRTIYSSWSTVKKLKIK